MILRDSLIGSNDTIMIGTISSEIRDINYTLNTLRYA